MVDEAKVVVYPNPAADFLAVQIPYATKQSWDVSLVDLKGETIKTTRISEVRTIAYFDVRTVYAGTYFLKLESGNQEVVRKVIIGRE